MSKYIVKNQKDIDGGSKTSNKIKILAGNLLITSILLSTAVVIGIPAMLGAKSLSKIVDVIIRVSKKLSKNKDHVAGSAITAIEITTFTGIMSVSSIFLATIAVTGIPAMLGAKFLGWIVNTIVPVSKKLSKNNKHIVKSTSSAIAITTFTGIMYVSSLILSSIAKTGIPAMIGSILMVGFISLNIFTFKILSKASKSIKKGSILMSIMSVSLLLFGASLVKISSATKDMNWKQIGIIGAITVELGVCIAALGIPVIFPFIALGSISLGIMSISLGIFAKSLKSLSTIKEDHKKSLNIVLSSMKTIRNFFIKNSLNFRAIKNAKRYKSLMKPFSNTIANLSKLNAIKNIPTKLVYQVLNAMSKIANYYIDNPISNKAIKQAKRYKKVLSPFAKTLKSFVKLKELGNIPIKLVYSTLDAMSTIANYYKENTISNKVIKQAKRYKKVLSPFAKTIKNISKLKSLGIIPTKLVHQTLNAMSTIANYYIDNPISNKAIKQAEKYKKVLSPFAKTLKSFVKLKELGNIPIKLVYSILGAMSTIANYYIDNPISNKAIKQAKRYKKVLSPFAKTLKSFVKLKELGNIPINLVNSTLDAISAIANYYKEQNLKKYDISTINKNASIINEILSSFSKSIVPLNELNKFKNIKIDSLKNIINIIKYITDFYTKIGNINNIEKQTSIIKYAIDGFTNMSKNMDDKLKNINVINYNTINSIIISFNTIINYYKKIKLPIDKKKIKNINNAVKMFLKNAELLNNSTQNFTDKNFNNVTLIVQSMGVIINFLKETSLNPIQRKRAEKNILLLDRITSVISNIANINSSNISSIGNTLSNTLDGVNAVDLGKVQAVTNMFNAFNGINKSENVINKFTESVKEFTTTCKNLMDAMNYNTDAINNMDNTGINDLSVNENRENNIIEIGTNNTTPKTNSVCISNVDEIARTIAEKINGVLSVDMPDTQVQLLINGTGGNEWTISRY